MRLYTKTGDDGTTGLFGGARVPKNDLRVTAYGSVDELNAAVGWVLVALGDPKTAANLRRIQAELFTLGAELATQDGKAPQWTIGDEAIQELERGIDAACAEVPPLRNFVLPGGSEAAARLHLARTVCRRAERDVVTLADSRSIRPQVLVYLNRLSDLLFALARAANHRAGVADIPWVPGPS